MTEKPSVIEPEVSELVEPVEMTVASTASTRSATVATAATATHFIPLRRGQGEERFLTAFGMTTKRVRVKRSAAAKPPLNAPATSETSFRGSVATEKTHAGLLNLIQYRNGNKNKI
jgi:hypothetical protein